MRAFVAITDNDWFAFLRRQAGLTEVSFWQPAGGRQFRALAPGQPLLFKLHAPYDVIAGGGFFATVSILPMSLAWSTFGIQNGAATAEAMPERVERYRRVAPGQDLQFPFKSQNTACHPERPRAQRGARGTSEYRE